MEKLIEEYLDHCRFERAVKQQTLRSYKNHLDSFRLFACDSGITEATVKGWIRQLMENEINVNTLNLSYLHLHGFLRWLADKERQYESVLFAYKKLTIPPPVSSSKALSEEACWRWLSQPDEWTRPGLRDRLYLHLCYASLRSGEVAHLTFDDLELEDGYVLVPSHRSKNNRERRIPLPDKTRELMMTYLRIWPKDKPKSGRIFDCSEVWLRKMAIRHAEAAGLGKQKPHTLRHSIATHLMLRGADMRAIQELLGHAKMSTTEIYCHMKDSFVARMVREHNPLNRPLSELPREPLKIIRTSGQNNA